jgi:hypothetical protein
LNPFWRAGAVDFFTDVCLPFLTNWLNVGILLSPPEYSDAGNWFLRPAPFYMEETLPASVE